MPSASPAPVTRYNKPRSCRDQEGGISRRRLTARSSTTVSANPTTYMATATALAKANIRPIEPPNSGPKLLEIK